MVAERCLVLVRGVHCGAAKRCEAQDEDEQHENECPEDGEGEVDALDDGCALGVADGGEEVGEPE